MCDRKPNIQIHRKLKAHHLVPSAPRQSKRDCLGHPSLTFSVAVVRGQLVVWVNAGVQPSSSCAMVKSITQPTMLRRTKFSFEDLALESHETALKHRYVILATLSITALCVLLTFLMLAVAPRAKKIPIALEAWMMHGWITGMYLSLSYTTIRPIAFRTLSIRSAKYLDIAHGLQIPFVLGGVGTWAIAKFLGFI
jgi:hypothetical protein